MMICGLCYDKIFWTNEAKNSSFEKVRYYCVQQSWFDSRKLMLSNLIDK